ncbi:OsmC family protein [Cyclobacterium jeungdonense]|uniref:OsmC family protein n=1 Tax=Cyclobacterium jeungdonense TaxID=708087 RepID=A0ABT8C9S0_9BACT|nr:OsmC family protein [Cyclobacterium jeungdonense]MDN3688378.1 OsmC family protein [Cyclobacterium jeungdonense]
MNKKQITLRMISDHEYESVNTTGNKVQIDMYTGEEKQHQSPMELLLSGLAGCSAVDTVLMMKKKRRNVQDFKIEAEGIRNDGTPSFYKSIQLHFMLTSPDATQSEFEKVVKLAVGKYCSVASSLKSEINYTAEVIRPA